MFLSIESSGSVCSIALGQQSHYTLLKNEGTRRHAPHLLDQIHQLLTQASMSLSDLQAIAVSVGPGNFTGLRLAIGVAQGLAFAAQLPVVAIDSLIAHAWQAHQALGRKQIAVINNAYMGQVYFGVYHCETNSVKESQKATLCSPDELDLKMIKDCLIVSNGLTMYPELLEMCSDVADIQLNAQAIAHLGEMAFLQGQILRPSDLKPNYLRGESAWKQQG